MKRILLIVFTALMLPLLPFAQVTTSSMSGTISASNGEPLPGATITATHQPSGTRYSTTSQSGGRFNITNMRVGGPYEVGVTYVGLQPQTFPDINLRLAETFVLDATMQAAAATLENVVVSTTGRNSILNANRTGAVTNVGRREIERLPSISRSINDLSRLTPQSNGAAVGGGNYRQNQITVDGAEFNNAFGIGSNLPAGGSPISLDALEEISVNITPFDVRQSGFIGSALNAVTRAGTNNFNASAYTFFRSEKQQGNKVGKNEIITQRRDYKQYGARVGGPIIKNKLFFFLNYENEKDVRPGQQKFASTADRPFVATNSSIARPTATELDMISTYLKSTYEYETGAYQGYDFEDTRVKYLARVDWNINDNHRFNVRYSHVDSKTPSFVSTSFGSTGIQNATGNRQDNYALHFKNSNYFQENNFYSFAAELNSKLGKFANTLRFSRNRQNEPRSTESATFPFVDILKDNRTFTSFGYEPFSFGNLRDVKITSIVDNLIWSAGKHNFTVGAQADFTNTKNGFQPLGASYYRFATWEDFVGGAKPLDFTQTYSLLPNFAQAFPSFKFSQYSIYGQDEIALTTKFRLTAGLRADLTTYPNVTEVKTNPLVAALTFENGAKINTGKLPKPTINWAPRVGFNWDIKGDRSFQVRGGTGIFTGRVPFVWIVGQSGNSGMLQVTQNYNGQTNTPGPFNPDPAAYRPATVPQAGTVIPSTVTAFSQDFKNPQTWKTTLGIDRRLPGGLVGSLEAIYNRDIRVTYSRNVNLVDPQPLNVSGYPDNRLFYPNPFNQRYINPLTAAIRSSTNPNPGTPVPNGDARGTQSLTAIVTGNEKQGHYYSITARLEKQFTKGFFGQVAYTYSDAENLYEGAGDQPVNTWNLIPSVNGPNFPTLGTANFVVPHRVIVSLSYRKEYLKHLGTTLSLFFQGSHQGRFSYLYGGDFNRDGANNDLIYIPKDASEITFAPSTIGSGTSAVTYTAQQQSDRFFSYIEQDKYLKKHKGEYAERSGGLLPWRNQVDVRFLQDIFTNIGGKRNTLQLSIDVFNFGNLLNSNWGAIQTTNVSSGQILVPTNTATLTTGGTTRPTFRLANDIVGPDTGTFRDILGITSTYYMQFGLRYIFGQ
ncbi:MAG: TonB-dependent receptor [Segetibacter sp.]|nr:TonB-dependent receptor [Segetibacter sp.]